VLTFAAILSLIVTDRVLWIGVVSLPQARAVFIWGFIFGGVSSVAGLVLGVVALKNRTGKKLRAMLAVGMGASLLFGFTYTLFTS